MGKSFSMDPRLQFEKPNYDEATWRSAVVTAKRDNLSLDSLSSLNIHHQDLIPQLVLLGLSIWVSPMLKSKSVATDRRRAKWNCIHLFLLFRFFGILGSFENSNACPKIWTLFVQTLILSTRLEDALPSAAARGEFVPVEAEVDQNDGGQGEGDDANRRQYVAKMAPVGGHKVEYTAGDKGKRDRIGAGHPLAVHGDLSVTRGDHGSGSADDPCSALHGGPRQPGTSGGKGDPGKGADDDGDEVHTARDAMELQVTLPKARRELQRAGQQSEGSAERVGDEESAVGYDLQAVGVVHGVIGDEKDL